MQVDTCKLCGDPEPDHDKTPGLICAYCGAPAQGCFSIHISPSMDGLTVPLCFECGKDPSPTCPDIWDKIEQDKIDGMFNPEALNGGHISGHEDWE
jgi:hypothetical protein